MLQRSGVVIGAIIVALALAACTARAAGPEGTSLAVSHGNEIGGYDELVDAPRGAGAAVEPAGEVQQPFFSVGGQVIRVNGAEIQVYEYANEATRGAESEQISPDGHAIGTTMISWVDQPSFWARGRVIVLHVGKDPTTLDLLGSILGEPLTDGVN